MNYDIIMQNIYRLRLPFFNFSCPPSESNGMYIPVAHKIILKHANI